MPAWTANISTSNNTPYYHTVVRNGPVYEPILRSFTNANSWRVDSANSWIEDDLSAGSAFSKIWDAAAESVEKEIEHQRRVDNEFKELLEAANG